VRKAIYETIMSAHSRIQSVGGRAARGQFQEASVPLLQSEFPADGGSERPEAPAKKPRTARRGKT